MDSMILLGQKNTLAEYMILSGADNRPPMLDKDLYDSWKSRMELYMQNRENGRMILESVENGPLIWPMIEENREKIQDDYDMKATNIILQGLPADIYSLVNHHRVAKDLWERVQLLMQGTSLTKQERECKLYDAFDKLQTTNFDHLMHIYIEQHELHVNEVHLMRERNQDPLALVANHQMTPSQFNAYQYPYNNPQFQQQFSSSQSPHYGLILPTQHYLTTYPSTPLAFSHPSTPYPNPYSSTVHQEACPQPSSVPQIEYTVSIVNQQTHMAEFPQIDSGLAVPVFKQGDDPIDAINKMMSFLSIGRQNSYANGTSGARANTSGTGWSYSGQQIVVKCFNCQGEGHMARQCPKPKRKRDVTWFRDKVLLVEAQGKGTVLNEEELEFFVDPGVAEGPITQSVITHNATYQADDLDAYDSDCDEISIAKAVLMDNLLSYSLDVLSEVPYSNNTHNDMLNQSVQEMPYSEQTHLDINSSAQQDAMILYVFEQLLNQVTNYNKVNEDNLIANEILSAELERYKERVKLLEERQNVDLEKESLTKTFNVFKNESKEKEARNIDKEIALEKKVKELDNIVCKIALGFQNPFYLKKAQQIRPMLYDGSVITKETNVISIVDSEETLMLEEES
ncbi:retrovirus-related pol polyprotein from transposon TNT 1-94 [Tanacetum coccineum]